MPINAVCVILCTCRCAAATELSLSLIKVPCHVGGLYDIDSYVILRHFSQPNFAQITHRHRLNYPSRASFVFTFHCRSLLKALKMYHDCNLTQTWRVSWWCLVVCSYSVLASDSMRYMKVCDCKRVWGGLIVSWKETLCSSCCIIVKFLSALNLSVFRVIESRKFLTTSGIIIPQQKPFTL